MDCSPPDSSAHGVSQARILKWVARIAHKHKFVKQTPVSHVSYFRLLEQFSLKSNTTVTNKTHDVYNWLFKLKLQGL